MIKNMNRSDLTGEKIGKWEVLYKTDERDKAGVCFYHCRCECGEERNVRSTELRARTSTSCGCDRNVVDIAGKRFGKLVVINRSWSKRKYHGIIWNCKCDCGNTVEVLASSLINGNTKSCGCLKKISYNYKHGDKHKKLYYVWSGIKDRCYRKKSIGYKNYGARGILMCEEWKNDYLAFREWALSNGYKEGVSIDRIDVNGNYCPENCRWVNTEIQANNKRTNRVLTYNNKSMTVAQWTRFLGIKNKDAIYNRLHLGWSEERALSTPF